jgi:YfiH family protein
VLTGSLGPGVRYAFASRADGVSAAPYDRANLADHVGDRPEAVAANRARLAHAVGVSPDRLAAMAPVHGRDVAVVGQGPVSDAPQVDALVTVTPGVALLVLAADCVPVLLSDPEAAVVAVAHAGWRGVRSDVTGAVLARMAGLGAHPEHTLALVGPAVCGRCYPVPEERFEAVTAVAPQAAAVAAGGGPALDLRAAVVARLRGAGVQVRLLGGCTVETPEWFSYRRDGVTGRHGGAVVLSDQP